MDGKRSCTKISLEGSKKTECGKEVDAEAQRGQCNSQELRAIQIYRVQRKGEERPGDGLPPSGERGRREWAPTWAAPGTGPQTREGTSGVGRWRRVRRGGQGGRLERSEEG